MSAAPDAMAVDVLARALSLSAFRLAIRPYPTCEEHTHVP